MGYRHLIHVVDSHTAGDPLRLIFGGIPAIKGKTIKEKVDYLKENCAYLLGVTMREPRGHREMFGAILVEPTREEADFGLIFMDTSTFYYGMCGHGTIAAATIVVEMGMVGYHEPITTVVFDTCYGLVAAEVEVKGHEVERVTIENVPSFHYRGGIQVNVDNIGSMTVDISYSGGFFIQVPVEQTGRRIEPREVRGLHSIAKNIHEAVLNENRVTYPSQPEASEEIDVFYYQRMGDGKNTYKILEILISSDQLCRSPCGTGTAALMAMLYSKGCLKLEEPFKTRSFLGTEFLSYLVAEVDEGQFKAVIPRVSASAYITGFNQLVVKPKDPLGSGFLI
jgi:proline racemase